jgi:hypothetical protein
MKMKTRILGVLAISMCAIGVSTVQAKTLTVEEYYANPKLALETV